MSNQPQATSDHITREDALAAFGSAALWHQLGYLAKSAAIGIINAELPTLFPGVNLVASLTPDGRIKISARP